MWSLSSHMWLLSSHIWHFPLKMPQPRNPPHPDTQILWYKFKFNQISIWICFARYREIRVCGFGGFWGCSDFSWNCHMHVPFVNFQWVVVWRMLQQLLHIQALRSCTSLKGWWVCTSVKGCGSKIWILSSSFYRVVPGSRNRQVETALEFWPVSCTIFKKTRYMGGDETNGLWSGACCNNYCTFKHCDLAPCLSHVWIVTCVNGTCHTTDWAGMGGSIL